MLFSEVFSISNALDIVALYSSFYVMPICADIVSLESIYLVQFNPLVSSLLWKKRRRKAS
jgi:hypothetical protein